MIIPEGVAAALDLVLERYSISQLTTLGKEGHDIVKREEHRNKTLLQLRMPEILSPEIDTLLLSQSSNLSDRTKPLGPDAELDYIYQIVVSPKESTCRTQSSTVSSVSSIASKLCRSIGDAISSCFQTNVQNKSKVSPDITITERIIDDNSRGR